jgi:hypothetical protein
MAHLIDETHVHEPKNDPRCARCMQMLKASIRKSRVGSVLEAAPQPPKEEPLSKQW